jgi:hypothetical protein
MIQFVARMVSSGFVRENRLQLFVTGDCTRKLGVVDVHQFWPQLLAGQQQVRAREG